MAITVVRQTEDNRVVAAFAEASDATSYSTGSGTGHDTVTLTDSQQGTETANSLLGKVVSNAGAVSNYAMAGATLLSYRRNQVYDLIEQGLGSVPPVSAEGDADANGVIHRYLRAVYAAASVDTNMNSATMFGEIEAAAKGGDLKSGIAELFRRIVTETSVRTAWNNALAAGATVLNSPNESGGVVAKTATLPTNWSTDETYHEARVIGR